MRVDAGVEAPALCHRLDVVTARSTEFVDLTDRLAALVRQAGLDRGVMVVQTRHTTTGLLVNEAEPRHARGSRGRGSPAGPRSICPTPTTICRDAR